MINYPEQAVSVSCLVVLCLVLGFCEISAKVSHPGKAKERRSLHGLPCESDRGQACQGLHCNVLAGSLDRIHVWHGVLAHIIQDV